MKIDTSAHDTISDVPFGIIRVADLSRIAARFGRSFLRFPYEGRTSVSPRPKIDRTEPSAEFDQRRGESTVRGNSEARERSEASSATATTSRRRGEGTERRGETRVHLRCCNRITSSRPRCIRSNLVAVGPDNLSPWRILADDC